MPANADSGSVKGPLINAAGLVLAALIGAGATVFVAFTTGHLTTPSDTREFQKDRQENTRLQYENAGLQQEIAGLRQENAGLKQQNASLHEETTQASTSPISQPQESAAAENRTVKIDNLVALLDGCEKNIAAVTCVAKVTNTKQDLVVRLYNDWTSIIDSTGSEQKVKMTAIGASTSTTYWTYAETTLPTNVPVKVRVSFEGVDSDVNRFSILTLRYPVPRE